MAKHCTACNRAFAESLEACPYCERQAVGPSNLQGETLYVVEGLSDESSSAPGFDSAGRLPPGTGESVIEVGELSPDDLIALQPAQPGDASPPDGLTAPEAIEVEASKSQDATEGASLEMNPFAEITSVECSDAGPSADLDASLPESSIQDSPDADTPGVAPAPEDFGMELVEDADSDFDQESGVEDEPAGEDDTPSLSPMEAPGDQPVEPGNVAPPDDTSAPITDAYQAFLARAMEDPLDEWGSTLLEEDPDSPIEVQTSAGTPTASAEDMALAANEAGELISEPAFPTHLLDAQEPVPISRIANDLQNSVAKHGVLIRTVASTDLLPENDGVLAPMTTLHTAPESKPDAPVFPFLPADPPELPQGNTWLKPGAIGAGIGLVAGFLLLWLCGFRWNGAHKSDASAAELSASLRLPDTEPLEPSARSSFSEWGGLDLPFRQALSMAAAQRYSPAAESLHAAIAARGKESSMNPDKKDTPEEQAAIKAIQANGKELTNLWKVEQRLLEEGYLNSRQRDPVAALNQLLEGHKTSHESLRGLAARFGAKLTQSAPVAFIHKEIDRLMSAKEYAEREAARLGVALENASGVRRLADEAAAKVHDVEQRLSTREAQLLAAERKIKNLLAAKIEAPPKPVPPPQSPVPQNRPIARDPALAYQHYAQGVALYQSGRYNEAEVELYWAVKRDEEDARYQYFLGLAQQALGKRESAAQRFRRGAELEQGHQPSPVFVVLALERARGEGLQVLNTYRR